MACNICSKTDHETNCPQEISFQLDGTILYGRCGAVPIRPIDLAPISDASETETSLSLDISNKYLRYDGEKDTDNVSITDIASLMRLGDLENVQIQASTEGDILAYINGQWVTYTVPNGTIVTPIGVSSDGTLVKDGSGGTPQAPDTVPLGGIITWSGLINTIPVSYRECNGQALSRSVYSDLFTLIGTRYGAGDGSTTFNLPNLKGRNVIGYDPNDTQFSTIGQTGGSKTRALSSANNGPHTHTGSTNSTGSHNHSITSILDNLGNNNTNNALTSYSGANVRIVSSRTTSSTGNHSHSFTTNSSGSGTAFSILDPYIAMPQIMRVV